MPASDQPTPGQLLAADSFRVRLSPHTGAAEVRGLSRHLERFTATATAILSDFRAPAHDGSEAIERLSDFLSESLPKIAAFGKGWPRLELWCDDPSRPPRLALQLRTLPELRDTIELRTAKPISVPHPIRKGPNIARYASLNRSLSAEALLVDELGNAREGATTSLIWWPHDTREGGNRGGFVRDAQRVASITEALLKDIVVSAPAPVAAKGDCPASLDALEITPGELSGHEVWAVNALHGIRVVTEIDGVRLPSPDEQRLRSFKEALDLAWEQVPASRV